MFVQQHERLFVALWHAGREGLEHALVRVSSVRRLFMFASYSPDNGMFCRATICKPAEVNLVLLVKLKVFFGKILADTPD